MLAVKKGNKCGLLVSCAVSALVISGQVSAQEGTAEAYGNTLEEILVTAQKRSQNLQDVPVSISVVTGATIANAGVPRLDALALLVPNLQINQDTLSDRISIRGIGSGEQAGFEQSVGTFVDGVYRGRGVQSRFAFLDIAAVEVLRGPQGTLFGKNTVAGALNITSAAPTSEFEGSAKYTYTPEFGQHEVTGYISVPINDRIRTRAAFQTRDMNKGWVRNAISGEDNPDLDEFGFRLSGEWDVTDSTLVSIKYERGEWDNFGGPFEHVEAGPLAALGVEDARDYSINQAEIDLSTGLPDPVQDFGTVQAFRGDNDEFRLGVVHDFSNGSKLTAIGAYSTYQFERFLDPDFSPVGLVRFDEEESQDQTTLELRYASEEGNTIDYLFGAFYLNADLFVDSVTNASIPTFEALTAAGCAAGDPATDAGTAFQCGTNAALAPLVGLVPGVTRATLLDQKTETAALFGQMTWRVTDKVRLTGGLRYMDEKKTAAQSIVAADYIAGSRAQTQSPVVTAVAEQLLEFTTHNFTDLAIDQNRVTWSINGQWDVSDNIMAYASVSTGFKAGGFNSFFTGEASGGGALPEDAVFEEERALSYEFGLKTSLLNNTLELNVTAFRTEFKDLQVAVFSGNTTFSVANAADATTQGIEMDFRWRPTQSLLITGGGAYTDFAFDTFPNQACTNDQFFEFRQAQFDGDLGPAAAALTAADCTDAGVNNLAGQTAVDTPELSLNLLLNYTQDIGKFRADLLVDYSFMTSVFRQGDLDPILKTDDLHLINAGLRFGPDDGPWELGLMVRNLTNVYEITSGNDVPISFGAFFATPLPPRSVAFSAQLNF